MTKKMVKKITIFLVMLRGRAYPLWAAAQAGLTVFDPSSAEHCQDPYAIYSHYRRRGAVQPGAGGAWFVFGYPEVAAALKDPRLHHSIPRPAAPPLRLFRLSPLFLNAADPPLHTRLRALVARAFTPAVVENLRAFIEARARQLLAGLGPRFDLLEDYSGPLALSVIAHMLGCPADDYPRFQGWSLALSRLVEDSSPAVVAAACLACDQLGEVIDDLLAQRRRHPQHDLLSQLLTVAEMSEDERVATCMLLLVAGHETTVHLIGNAVLAALPGWGARAAIGPTEVEEFLRYDAPGRLAWRYAAEDLTLGDQAIGVGSRIGLLVGSANRDPAVFDRPDQLDFQRPGPRHLSFGAGPHYCLGAGLARLEAEIALNTLLKQRPQLRLVPELELEWQPRPAFRALKSLPVTS